MEKHLLRVKPFLRFVNISFIPGEQCTISNTSPYPLPIGFMSSLPNIVTNFSENGKSAWYPDPNGEIDSMNNTEYKKH
jgi:hypothetical protein